MRPTAKTKHRTTPSMSREELEAEHGADNVWDTRALARFFVLVGIDAHVVVVIRKSDGVAGRLRVQFGPTFFYGFEADRPCELKTLFIEKTVRASPPGSTVRRSRLTNTS